MNEVTSALRRSHSYDGDPESITRECPNHYSNTAARPAPDRCECVAVPLWWDENGVPRFDTHHPGLCPDIYADEVALLRIACQGCEREFLVQMSACAMSAMAAHARETHGAIAKLLDETLTLGIDSAHEYFGVPAIARMRAIRKELAERRSMQTHTLAELVTTGAIHYGDPPSVGCCPAGDTMNCEDLAVVEFWRRGWDQTKAADGVPLADILHKMNTWHRVTELEIPLPDRNQEGAPA
jgi:hypothetical protein